MESDLLKRKNVIRVKEFLDKNDQNINLIVLDDTARTAIDAAKSLNKEVGAIVKSLSFKDSNNNFYLCLVSGDKYLSEKKLSKLISNEVMKANAEEVKEYTGFTIGGVSPFAHLNKPKFIYVDENLDKYPMIYAAAGHPHVVFGIKFITLVELTGGKIVNIVK